MKLIVATGVCLAMLAGASPAPAKAPQPVRPVQPSLYSGRWYQIAGIAKADQHFCAAATDDFGPDGHGGLSGVATCHEGNASGKAHEYTAKVSILPGSGAAKFKMSFFGGLISQEYWVLDHADDQSWALMATPGGNYLWLIARRPNLDPRVRQAAITRIAALGYDVSKLKPSR
jgi:apolipoprotein D and lipocalin family protein